MLVFSGRINMLYFIISTVMAVIAVIGFCIIFDVPRNELIICGCNGGFGWLIYSIAPKIGISEVLAAFISTTVIMLISCFLAKIRKKPFTVFLIGGIIPLVPGGSVYYTMLNIIINNNREASNYFINCVKIAAAIACGIIIVFPFAGKIYKNVHLKK